VLTFGAGRALTGVARTLGRGAASAAKPSYIASLRASGSTRAQARATARQVDWSGTRRIVDGRSLRARAAERAPWVPRPREVAEALSPRGITREAFADIAARQAHRAGGVLPSQAPDGVLDVVRGLPAPVQATPEVSAAMRSAGTAGRLGHGAEGLSAYNDLRELGIVPPYANEPVPGSAR
jgi:hypothetical protein